MHHHLRPRSHERRDVPGTGRDAHQSRPAAAGGLAGEPCRTGEPVVTAHDEHVAEPALVRVTAARADQSRAVLVRHPPRGRLHPREHVFGHPEVAVHDLAPAFASFPSEQALFQTDEAHGDGRTDRAAEHAAGVGVDPRRNVQRQHRRGGIVHRPHRLGRRPGEVASQSRPEQRIDDDVGVLRHGPDRGRTGSCIEHAPVRGAGVATDPCGVPDQADQDRQSLARGESCDHEPVAAIVAGTRDHRHAARRRPPFAQHPEGFEPRALHQVDAGNTRPDRPAIELAHVASPVQRGREHRTARVRGRGCRVQSSRSSVSR